MATRKTSKDHANYFKQGSCQKIVGMKIACNSGFPNLAFPNLSFPNLAFPNLAFHNLAFPNLAFPNLAFPNLAFPNLAFPKGYACATGRILHDQKSCQPSRCLDV